MFSTNQQIRPKGGRTLLSTTQVFLIILWTIGEHSEGKGFVRRSTDDVTQPEDQYRFCIVDLDESAAGEEDAPIDSYDVTLSPFDDDDVNATDEIDDVFFKRFSPEFLSCGHVSVIPGCYEKFDNGSVHVPIYSKTFNESDYFIDDKDVLSICPSFFNKSIDENKFPTWMSTVSNLGVSVSLVCIVLHMIMFVVLPKLRNLPGYCLFSLCVALKVAYTCFFLPMALPENADCSGLGMVMYYSFLTSFFWMNTMSYDVWRSLRLATSKLRVSGDKPLLVRFALYSLYSWGSPLLILVSALIVSSAKDDTDKYRLVFNHSTCWFMYKQALGVYFAFPIFTLLFINVGFFVHSSIMISSASMKSSENSTFLWTRFLVSLRLAVVMGLTWIFGVLATATQDHVLFCFYSIFTALQGVFIFFSFTLSEKTKKACKMAINSRKCSLGTSTSHTQSQNVTSI